jgi:FMN phosphatase YigB (HAD superfamily)
MAVKAVFFDVGETLVDETRYWAQHAERLGVTPHVVWAALGATIARGEHHRHVFELLGGEPADEVVYSPGDLYPDALPCLERLHRAGYFVGIAGNQSAQLEEWARGQELPADVVASSASWGVEKPSPEFFARVVAATGAAPHEVAYVGDRVDNDVVPAREAGLVAVQIRRGPWAYLQVGPDSGVLRIRSLDELPEAFDDA